MGKRYCDGVVPAAEVEGDFEKALKSQAAETAEEALRLCDGMQFHMALEKIFSFIRSINKYAEQRAPWKLAKSPEDSDKKLLYTTLANMAEALRIAAVLLLPVMPTVGARILTLLGAETPLVFEAI
ncbi:MAG: class I tRNA ligase family protein [Bacilli bacterium]